MSTRREGGGFTAPQKKFLKDQLAFDARVDLKRFRGLLNQLCEATGHEDYEAAVETLLTDWYAFIEQEQIYLEALKKIQMRCHIPCAGVARKALDSVQTRQKP